MIIIFHMILLLSERKHRQVEKLTTYLSLGHTVTESGQGLNSLSQGQVAKSESAILAYIDKELRLGRTCICIYPKRYLYPRLNPGKSFCPKHIPRLSCDWLFLFCNPYPRYGNTRDSLRSRTAPHLEKLQFLPIFAILSSPFFTVTCIASVDMEHHGAFFDTRSPTTL